MVKQIVSVEMPTIRVVLRKDKKNKEDKYSLNYLVRYQGKDIKKPTGVTIKLKNWNEKKKEVIGTTKEIERIRVLLDKTKSDFGSYMLWVEAAKRTLCKKTIDDFFDNKSCDDFGSYFEDHYKARIELADSTLGKYKRCLEILKQYGKTKHIDQLRFSDIVPSFIVGFDRYLIHNLVLTSDTANNYHKKLKAVIKYAMIEDIILKNPYAGLKLIKTNEDKTVTPLTEEQILAIEVVEFPDKKSHLYRVRDCFVFMLNTGIRYEDFFSLRKENLKSEYVEGKKKFYLQYMQGKTNAPVSVPLNRKAYLLLRKFQIKYKLADGFFFPRIKNPVYNKQLKEVAKFAKVDARVFCHLGRHTCATSLRRKGVSLETVGDILGHKDPRMTRRYAKISINNLHEAVSLL